MIRTLLTTTAVAVLMGTAAIAQTTPAPADSPATTTEAPAAPTTPPAPAEVNAAPVESGAPETTEVREPWDMSRGYIAADTDNLATRLIGQPVYSSSGEEAEEIGSVSDLVFSEGGQIEAVVIGVGGFLGIGAKNVAVDFKSLEFTLAADNTERWVLPTTADALTAAPEFVWKEDKPAETAPPADAMAPAPVTTN